MMSILLFTFESALHCQPGVIDSVSLLPVANVVESLVTKPVDYAEVETGTAARAAKLIAELL